MDIKLSDCPAIVINLPDARMRRRFSTRLLTDLGIPHQFSPGETRFGKKRNVARAHINAMALAPRKGPFMILEDDLEFLLPEAVLRDVPADADIVYLGVSQSGCLPRGSLFRQVMGHRTCEGFVLSEDAGPRYVRLYSMISAHAVLYVSKAGREAYHKAQIMADRREMALDISYADIMPDLKVYGLRQPAFAEDMRLQIRTKNNDDRFALTHSPLTPVTEGETRHVEHHRYTLSAEVRRNAETGALFWHATDMQVLEPALADAA